MFWQNCCAFKQPIWIFELSFKKKVCNYSAVIASVIIIQLVMLKLADFLKVNGLLCCHVLLKLLFANNKYKFDINSQILDLFDLIFQCNSGYFWYFSVIT